MANKKQTAEQLAHFAKVNDRSVVQQEELEARLESMGPFKMVALMDACFGGRRTMELIGWAAIWGVMGVQSVGEMRKSYEAAGLSRTSAYRAASDFKKFADFILEQTGDTLTMKEILGGLVNGVPQTV